MNGKENEMSNKNPAVLWYTADYLIGVMGLGWEEQGRYAYLLNMQHQKGHLDIPKLMPDCPEIVYQKFVKDDDGLWYNERMEEEIRKRKAFSESRANNRRGGKRSVEEVCKTSSSLVEDMENENEDDNDSVFEYLWSLYPKKRGKGQISKTQKAKLEKIGKEQLERCINRYTSEQTDMQYLKNGSTFFNSGYVDYLDENYSDLPKASKANPFLDLIEGE